jgi:uncharacterized BrkB/YihY/UPF0761 family membrane protein
MLQLAHAPATRWCVHRARTRCLASHLGAGSHSLIDWYSTTYGAFGIVIAGSFWIILIGTVLILAAAVSPALAHGRDLRAARV